MAFEPKEEQAASSERMKIGVRIDDAERRGEAWVLVNELGWVRSNSWPFRGSRIKARERYDQMMNLPRTKSQEQHFFKGYLPNRHTSSIPPDNFGAVLEGKIYRSAFPSAENLNFLNTIGIRTVVTLVEAPYPTEYNAWIHEHNLRHFRIPLQPNKGGVQINFTDMANILSVVQNQNNYPLLIHCNKGKHRTGCVVGTYRLLLGMAIEEIVHEYHTYAGKKARAFDEQYLRTVDTNVMQYLQTISQQDGSVVDQVIRDEYFMNILTLRPAGSQAQACRPEDEETSSTPSMLSPRLLR